MSRARRGKDQVSTPKIQGKIKDQTSNLLRSTGPEFWSLIFPWVLKVGF
jgi:hypothetical protein